MEGPLGQPGGGPLVWVILAQAQATPRRAGPTLLPTPTMSSFDRPLTHPPADMELVLKVIPMPADCNASGDIFGGWVMAQVDLAGAVLPARRVKGRIATVAVNEFIFKQAVKVGDILSFFARIVKVGRTSVTVEVEVFAERFALQGQYIKVTEARLTYVAIDSQGKPCPVPAE